MTTNFIILQSIKIKVRVGSQACRRWAHRRPRAWSNTANRRRRASCQLGSKICRLRWWSKWSRMELRRTAWLQANSSKSLSRRDRYWPQILLKTSRMTTKISFRILMVHKVMLKTILSSMLSLIREKRTSVAESMMPLTSNLLLVCW